MRKLAIARLLAIGILLSLAGCSNSGTSPQSNESGSTQTPEQKAVEKVPPPKPIMIEAGTVLTVTIDQSISTKTNQAGDHFDASLAEPVAIEGKDVLPVGTKASGVISQAQSAGHVKGGALLALSLDSITVHGKVYSIQTSAMQEAGKGRGKRTAVGGGGGAAFGAIVGAIAGGGKGAAIGALAGGGAGTAGAAYTGNRDITLPAETTARFKLTQPLEIRPR
jgi:hypothetical protein